MLAIRRKPREPDRPALRDLARVDVPHRFAVVARLRVVYLVHRDGLGVMVDRDVDVPAERKLNAARRATAPGEVVDDDFGAQVEDELIADHQAEILSSGLTVPRPPRLSTWV